MREIKFRVFNKDLDDKPNMIYLDEGELDMLSCVYDDMKENIWMQYTGIKNKAGKEIYEGDII